MHSAPQISLHTIAPPLSSSRGARIHRYCTAHFSAARFSDKIDISRGSDRAVILFRNWLGITGSLVRLKFPFLRNRVWSIALLLLVAISANESQARHHKKHKHKHKHKPPAVVSAAQAARFLNQSTFGPTNALLTQMQQRDGFNIFLAQQFALPPTPVLPRVDAAIAQLPQDQGPSNPLFQEAWWYTIVNAPDQLRQRVAFALSEIFVISAQNSGMYEHPEAMATYWDMLARDAFGNFRQLVEDVTLNPAMGDYLDMVHNDKPNPRRNTEPNENYAREVMQLFTIGLWKLNPDGTQQLDSNRQPIPSYDQDTVEGYAHVFTGWYWAQSGTPTWNYVPANYRSPMMAFSDHHDTGA